MNGLMMITMMKMTMMMKKTKTTMEEVIVNHQMNNQSFQPQPVSANNSSPSISDVERQRLAAEAGKHGVMQAIDPNQQGSSGWYVDVSGEIQYWNVGADGSWTRGA